MPLAAYEGLCALRQCLLLAFMASSVIVDNILLAVLNFLQSKNHLLWDQITFPSLFCFEVSGNNIIGDGVTHFDINNSNNCENHHNNSNNNNDFNPDNQNNNSERSNCSNKDYYNTHTSYSDINISDNINQYNNY